MRIEASPLPEQMRSHRAARRRLSAVLAAHLKGGDGSLSRPVPVGLGQRQAALGAAAGIEANPAVDAVAVALVALVHLALGHGEAHAALVCHHAVQGPVPARESEQQLMSAAG